MTRMKFVLFQKCHRVSKLLYTINIKLILFIIDQRGISQEVSLVTKKGVETKSYEGVSYTRQLTKKDYLSFPETVFIDRRGLQTQTP